MPSMFAKYETDPDPVVASLATAHGAALRAGETRVAKSVEAEIKKLTDPGYGMYAALREAVRYIDQFRYHHGVALAAIKTSPTSSRGLAEQGDEFFGLLASKLTQACVEYGDPRGWTDAT